jgi:ribosomal protein L37E
MWLLSILTDGGGQRPETKHYECRKCGTNLLSEAPTCPDCGGGVAVYTF